MDAMGQKFSSASQASSATKKAKEQETSANKTKSRERSMKFDQILVAGCNG
jgi:hypothetical protein